MSIDKCQWHTHKYFHISNLTRTVSSSFQKAPYSPWPVGKLLSHSWSWPMTSQTDCSCKESQHTTISFHIQSTTLFPARIPLILMFPQPTDALGGWIFQLQSGWHRCTHLLKLKQSNSGKITRIHAVCTVGRQPPVSYWSDLYTHCSQLGATLPRCNKVQYLNNTFCH